MKTLIELAKEKNAEVGSFQTWNIASNRYDITKTITFEPEQLQATFDDYCKQFEPKNALLLEDLTPTYCNDSGNILGGKKRDLKDVFLAPQQIPSEVKAYIERRENVKSKY